MSSHDDDLLDPAVLSGLADRPIQEVRSQRAACTGVETGLSYLRRLIQGSIDIIERELGTRSGGGADSHSPGELVDTLPDILGEQNRPPGVGRLPQTIEPVEVDDELATEYDELVGGGRLAQVTHIDDDKLRVLIDSLRELEQRVSTKRKAYFDRIDALQAELTRRYQTGEASVDTLLEST